MNCIWCHISRWMNKITSSVAIFCVACLSPKDAAHLSICDLPTVALNFKTLMFLPWAWEATKLESFWIIIFHSDEYIKHSPCSYKLMSFSQKCHVIILHIMLMIRIAWVQLSIPELTHLSSHCYMVWYNITYYIMWFILIGSV